MKKVFIIPVVVLFFTQCNSSDTPASDKSKPGKSAEWPSADKEKFTKECTDAMGLTEAGKKTCDCILEKVMKKYKNLEEADKDTSDDARQMAMDCVPEELRQKLPSHQ